MSYKKRVLAKKTNFTPNFASPLGDELGVGQQKFQWEWVPLIDFPQKSDFWWKKSFHFQLCTPVRG